MKHKMLFEKCFKDGPRVVGGFGWRKRFVRCKSTSTMVSLQKARVGRHYSHE